MNAFQKQLKLGDKCMAELAGQDRNGVGQAVPPARVSVEEFLSRPTQRTVDRLDVPAQRTHRYWNCPKYIVGENNLSTNWDNVDCPNCLVVGGKVSPFATSGN